MELEPDHTAALAARAFARVECLKFEKTVLDFDWLVALVPDNNHAYYRRACVSASLDQPRQAMEDFTQAIDLDHRAR